MSYPSLIPPSDPISLTLHSNTKYSHIIMQFPDSLLSTTSLPKIDDLLTEYLPSIFTSTCYNPQNLLFKEEVKKTEIAHLFEHIVLEYLVLSSIQRNNRVYEGETSWDWRKEERGIFRIKINVGAKESFHLAIAIDKAYKLLNQIIKQHNITLT